MARIVGAKNQLFYVSSLLQLWALGNAMFMHLLLHIGVLQASDGPCERQASVSLCYHVPYYISHKLSIISFTECIMITFLMAPSLKV